MATMRMREALRDAMAEEMRNDETVFLTGTFTALFGGVLTLWRLVRAAMSGLKPGMV